MIQMFLLIPSPFLPQNGAIINKVDMTFANLYIIY